MSDEETDYTADDSSEMLTSSTEADESLTDESLTEDEITESNSSTESDQDDDVEDILYDKDGYKINDQADYNMLMSMNEVEREEILYQRLQERKEQIERREAIRLANKDKKKKKKKKSA